MGAFYIGTIMILRFVQSYFNKKVSSIFPGSAKARSKYVALSMGASAFFGIITLMLGGFSKITLSCILLATASGLALAINKIISPLAMKNGTMVMSSVFSTAGLIVPCVAGIFFFDEPMSIWQWAGVAIFIFGAFFLASYSKNTCPTYSFKTVIYLFFVFLLNGITMLCQKLLTFLDENANVSMFSLLSFAIPAFIFFILSLFQKDETNEKLNKKIYLPMLILATAVFIINQFATLATYYVSSVVLFTLINGGATVISFAVAAICFKEKPNFKSVLGLILTLGGIMLVNIFK